MTFKGPMAFEGLSESGHRIIMDASEEVGGENRGVRPMELVLLSLGGCTGMDVVSILRKMRVTYTAFEIEIDADRVLTHPKVYERLMLRYRLEGDRASSDQIIRAVKLSQEKYCSVSAMLARTAEVLVEIVLNGETIYPLSQRTSVDP
ncbi:MAG: OsmC family protein [Firmicutes bacterium]|nr:OsmC family protein [Bacillota bacterium]